MVPKQELQQELPVQSIYFSLVYFNIFHGNYLKSNFAFLS